MERNINFKNPIYTEQTECQDCYRCIRHCPVKAIMVENGHAKIIPELCIMCGTCVKECPSNAKRIRNDLDFAKQILTTKEKVFVSLAPSFVSEFAGVDYRKIIAALKKLGFYGVSETSVGADFVCEQIAQDLQQVKSEKKENEQKLFLSSACPAVVEYIKQKYPEFSKYITDRASPLLAHSRFLKKMYGEEIGVVFIGPCIAKKREADTWNTIDCVLTFSDFRNWLNEEKIELEQIPIEDVDFVPVRASKASLFPIDGGMVETVKQYSKDSNFYSITVSGMSEIEKTLKNLNEKDLKENLFVELLSCFGGCVNGPVTSQKDSTAMKRIEVLNYAENCSEKLENEILKSRPKIEGTLPKPNFQSKEHTEEEIRSALRSVGKTQPSDELNCASCGYDSCRSFAKAMLDNRAEKTMCVSYMKKLAQKKANSLIKVIPSGVVIVDKNLKIVECNKNFAKMLGEDILTMYEIQPGLAGAELEKLVNFSNLFTQILSYSGSDSDGEQKNLGNDLQDEMQEDSQEIIDKEIQFGKKILHISVFIIEKEEIAGAVIEDVTTPQVQKRRIVDKAQKVINKNLSTVQKIAFLLGENAAESESILNSIIESFSDEEDDI